MKDGWTINGLGRASKPDAYTPWYTIWCGAFLLWNFVVEYLDEISNLYLAIVPLIFLPLLILAATLVISLAVNVFRRRWRKAISIIAAPIIAVSFFGLLGRLGINTQLIRLELSKSSYMAQIDALPNTDGPRLKCWNWGWTGGAAVVNIGRALVYDEDDQIALPQSARSAEWLRKAAQAEKSAQSAKGNDVCQTISLDENSKHSRFDGGVDLHTSVAHLEGHFYVVEELFQ